MSNEINATHVASFLRLSARYIDGAWTGLTFIGKAAPVPVVPGKSRAGCGEAVSLWGAGDQGTAPTALRLSGGSCVKPRVPAHAPARISKSAHATTSMDTPAGW